MHKLLYTLFISLFTLTISAQDKYTISGSVYDKKGNETLIGATIYFPDLSVGTTTSASVLNVNSTEGSSYAVTINCTRNSGSSGHIIDFHENSFAGNRVGTITSSGSSTSYNTSSDYRLKENVDYDWDATTRLKQLKPARFNFIADSDTIVDGFLAHEAAEVVPEAVSGVKDAMMDKDVYDKDGNVTGTESVINPQSIDQAKLVPLLVKTIQELEARITALEA